MLEKYLYIYVSSQLRQLFHIFLFGWQFFKEKKNPQFIISKKTSIQDTNRTLWQQYDNTGQQQHGINSGNYK